MARVVAFISTFCLIFLLIAAIAYNRFFVPGGGIFHRSLDAPAVVQEVRQLNQLVTVKYSLQKVVGLTEQHQPLGSESILLLVEAHVLAGVDLGELTQYDVNFPSRDEVKIRLHPAQITETFVDEKNTKVWDRRITWWTPWLSPDLNLEHNARLEALKQVQAAALGMGILKDAQNNAERAIRSILQVLGIKKITFIPYAS